MRKNPFRTAGVIIGSIAALQVGAIADETADPSDPVGNLSIRVDPANAVDPSGGASDDLDELAKKSANPVSDIWILFTQNDTTQLKGDNVDGDQWVNSLKIQPVMSVPFLEGEWNFIVRPVFQFQSVPLKKSVGDLNGKSEGEILSSPSLAATAADPYGRTNGLGDTALLTLVGPNREDGMIWGLGATQIFPTADEGVLGQGKWQAGPAALIARIAPNPGRGLFESSNMGLLAQHWWSYGGDGDRASTSQTDIQYFFNYRPNARSLIGMAPNIRIDWTEDNFDDAVTIPIGLGYSNIIKIGKLPIRLAAEVQYSVVAPDDSGSGWNFRLIFAPIIKNPFK